MLCKQVFSNVCIGHFWVIAYKTFDSKLFVLQLVHLLVDLLKHIIMVPVHLHVQFVYPVRQVLAKLACLMKEEFTDPLSDPGIISLLAQVNVNLQDLVTRVLHLVVKVLFHQHYVVGELVLQVTEVV